MLIDTPDALKSWLTLSLEPICDADPAALAKYVMALLKKDKAETELKEFCIEQLDVFLQKETTAFVEKLFAVMRDRSYIPTSAANRSVALVPSGGEALKQRQQTAASAVGSAAAAEHAPAPAPPASTQSTVSVAESRRRRISPPPPLDEKRPPPTTRDRREPRESTQRRSRSRSPRGEPSLGREKQSSRRGGVTRPERGGREKRRSRSRERDRPSRFVKAPEGPSTASSKSADGAVKSASAKDGAKVDEKRAESKKSRCRDYDEKGYCMRGDLCPFDHGPDPVVVDDVALPKMIAITGGKTSNGGARVVAAGFSDFSVPPPGYTPLNPPPPGVDNVYVPPTSVATGATEPYNPESPALTEPSSTLGVPPPDFTIPPPPFPASVVTRVPWHGLPYPRGLGARLGQKRLLTRVWRAATWNERAVADGVEPADVGLPLKLPRMASVGSLQSRLGPQRGRGGRFIVSAAPPLSRENKTLEVRKIPPQMNNISKLNEHFAQFGQITNIQVRYDEDNEAALITYANRHQAQTAYRSTEPILNNRFIKVFWHGANSGAEQQPAADADASPPKPTGRNVVNDSEDSWNAGRKAVMLTSRGSLTKTLYNPDAIRAAIKKEPPTAVDSPPKASQAETQENYVAVRRRRKADKQNKLFYLDLFRKKSDLLMNQLKQQKLLIDGLDKVKDIAQKKELISMLKSIDKSVRKLKTELDEISSKLAVMAAEKARSKDQVEKEALDVELELLSHKEAGAATGDLQRRLDDLKQELMSATLKETAPVLTSTPVQSDSSPVGADRARTTSASRKPRAVIPNTANLDKRPRHLVVAGFLHEEREALVKHLQQFGALEDVEFAKTGKQRDQLKAVVVYKTRKDAEQALSLASDFNERSIDVAWASRAASAEGTDVVPDGSRAPSDQVTAEQLLASLGDESDDSAGRREADGDDDAFADDAL